MAEEIRYSYRHAPTLWKFAQSDSFIRGLLGPFRCLPGDTEFLTPQGWKRMDAYVPGDLVAQWDHRDGATVFVLPIAYIKEPTDGFLRFNSGRHIMEMTPNHRVPHYDWKGTFRVREASELAATPSRCKIPIIFTPNDRPGLPMSDALIRFAVMMHGDGYYPKQGLKAVVAVRKERKKERIRATLTLLGVEWKETISPKRPTETRFTFVPPYRGKRFTGDWWKATSAQLAVVFDEMRYWDGHTASDKLLYFSAYKEDADFIQYAAHVCGYRADIVCINYPTKPKWRPTYKVGIKRGYKNVATIRADMTVTKIAAADGLQYCFNVPTGFFVVRCKGSIFITGNSGKSSACSVEILRRAQQQAPGADGIRRTRWLVVRNTIGELRDTTVKTFMMWAPEHHFGIFNKTSLSYHITGLPGCDIEVWFRALDRPDHIKHLLSLEVTGAWINEAREVPWSIIEAIQGRVGQYPSRGMGGATWFGLFMDTNAPDVTSRWYKFFEEKEHDPAFAQIFKQPSGLASDAENLPYINTGRMYYERLSTDKDQEWVNVYIHGKYGFTRDGKAVFPEYSDELHCKKIEPVPGLPIYRSWDFGLTPACCFSQMLPDQRWLIFDEMTSDDMSVENFADIVLDHCVRSFKMNAQFIDIGDPAGVIRSEVDARSVFQMLRAKHIDIQPGIQAITVRLESMRKPMRRIVDGKPQFVLHPRCAVLRKALIGGYVYKRLRVAGERYQETPDKNQWSHICDAAQYAASILFGSSVLLPREGYQTIQEDNEAYDDSTRSEHTGY